MASLVDVLNPPPIGDQVHPGGAIKPSTTFMALLSFVAYPLLVDERHNSLPVHAWPSPGLSVILYGKGADAQDTG